MKFKIILSFIFSFFFFASKAQYKYLFYLNEQLGSVPKDSAVIIGKGFPDADLLQVDCFIKLTGRLFMRLHFSDSTLSSLNGPAQTFYESGMMEAEGSYKDGIENGLWIKLNESGLLLDSSYYEDGQKVIKGVYEYNDDTLSSYEFKDTKVLRMIRVIYNPDGSKAEEADFTDNTGTYTTYTNGVPSSVPVFTRVIKNPEFPEGINKFTQYIDRNINSRVADPDLMPSGNYRVLVNFDIDKKGKVHHVRVDRKVGFGLDEEAIRLVSQSPKWIPATRYGIPVEGKSFYTINFIVHR